MTRLASRAHFNEVADARIAAAKEHNTPLALLLIDLDHFKLVNDSCGHPVGDEVLRCVAECLQSPSLADSFAARLGGDEFVVLIDSPQLLRDLPGFVRRLLAGLCQTVGSDHNDIGVSATIGVGWLDAGVTNRSDLLHRVDRALYQAKRARRGSAVIFGQFDLIVPEPVAGTLSIVH